MPRVARLHNDEPRTLRGSAFQKLQETLVNRLDYRSIGWLDQVHAVIRIKVPIL
jgi:hypothetical protein